MAHAVVCHIQNKLLRVDNSCSYLEGKIGPPLSILMIYISDKSTRQTGLCHYNESIKQYSSSCIRSLATDPPKLSVTSSNIAVKHVDSLPLAPTTLPSSILLIAAAQSSRMPDTSRSFATMVQFQCGACSTGGRW